MNRKLAASDTTHESRLAIFQHGSGALAECGKLARDRSIHQERDFPILTIRAGKDSLPILMFTHDFVDIDQEKSALSVKDRFDIKKKMDFGGYLRGNCHFFRATNLN